MTQKEWYNYCKENGLCVSCHKPSDTGKRYCSKCAEKARQRNADQRAAYIEKGICPICRTNDLMGNEKACVECRAKQAEADQKRDHGKVYHFKKIRRTKLRSQGKCIDCGNEIEAPGYVRCLACREKRRRRYDETQAIHRSKRTQNGKCYICGSDDLAEGQKLCVLCYKRVLKNAAKMNDAKRQRKTNDATQPD